MKGMRSVSAAMWFWMTGGAVFAGLPGMLDPADIASMLRRQLDQSAECAADPGVAAIRAGDLAGFQEAVPDASALKTFGPGNAGYLHLAALEGHTEIATYLVGLGVAVDSREITSGMSPLLYAILANHEATARWLLEAGAKTEQTLLGGFRPVHFAALFGGTNLMAALARRGANLQAEAHENVTPIVLAAGAGRTELVTWLADHGVSVEGAKTGPTPLQAAAAMDHADTALALLDRGADPDRRGVSTAPTPLSLTAMSGGSGTAAILLDRGAEVNAVDGSKRSPLIYAVNSTNLVLVDLLVEHGADVQVRDAWQRTLLIHSTYSDDPEVIRHIYALDQDIQAKGVNGADALFHATLHNHNRALRTLLDLGADPSTVEDHGQTALMKAAESGNLVGVKMLVEAGADINAIQDNGMTVLLYAAKPENSEVFLYLLGRGAQLFPAEQECWPVTLMLAWDGHTELFKELIDSQKPDLDWTDNDHQTALMLAVRASHPDVVKLLLDSGADPTIRDVDGLTAWHLAELLGESEAARMLAGHMTPEDRMPTNRVRVYFDLEAPLASNVYVGGTFNDWEISKNPMTRREDDGWWYTEVDLFPLWYQYKFNVDGSWISDPLVETTRTDEYINSVQTRIQAETHLAKDRPTRPVSHTPDVYPVTFTYQNAKARRVYLAGEFNGWNDRSLRMKLTRVGEWSITHDLPAGEHAYKFVVDGEWIRDPANRETKEVDGVVNSMIRVPAAPPSEREGGGNKDVD